MLVLTRKKSETIRIGEDIVIKVIRTSSGSVKLGIEAPASIPVLRGELSEVSGDTGGADQQSARRHHGNGDANRRRFPGSESAGNVVA